MDAATLIDTIADDNATIPDIREVLGRLNAAFGGVPQVASMIVEDIKAAPGGSSQRLTFWTNYIASIAKFGGNDDLDRKSQDELKAEAQALMKELSSE